MDEAEGFIHGDADASEEEAARAVSLELEQRSNAVANKISEMQELGAAEDGVFKGNLYYPTVPDYVAIAFEAARAAAPTVKLFYND